MLQVDRPEMAIWCKRIACWIPKTTNTNSEHVIIIAFPLQQWLDARASEIRYTYIDCLVRSVATKYFTKSEGIN